jgi:hypothetical protein
MAPRIMNGPASDFFMITDSMSFYVARCLIFYLLEANYDKDDQDCLL